jgi:hypothetical protein
VHAYVTRANLAQWLYGTADESDPRLGDLPTVDRLLARASELVEGRVLAAYGTDSEGRPTDPDVAAWLADAACAQVEFWNLVSEEHSIAGVRTGTLSVGGVSHNMPNLVGPRVIDILDRAGLRHVGTGAREYRRPLNLIGRTYYRGTTSITQTGAP